MSRIYTVAEITGEIRQTLEKGFPHLWVRGQVTNLSRPGSGHLYFTLKDEQASLSVVWFKGSQRTARYAGTVDPLTGEVTYDDGGPDIAATLADGQEVMCAGRLAVYPPRGSYQLVAETVQDMGLGKLFLQFEALKRDLAAKGFFDEDRKMALPPHPEKVALITAKTGAAVRDFLRLASDRGWGSQIRLYPVLVQGDAAPGQIAEALDLVNADGWADVVVLIRGGGSLEDLWAFNTLPVAEAIYRSTVPVVCGVGHEVDFSIADMVADVRAATPSHAAQIVWPERGQLVRRLDDLSYGLDRAFESWFADRERTLGELERALSLLSPDQRIERWEERFAVAQDRLTRAVEAWLNGRDAEVDEARRALGSMFSEEWFRSREMELDGLVSRLTQAGNAGLDRTEQLLERMALRLDGLDPEKPLERGYSLVRVAKTGRFLRSAGDVSPGDRLDIAVRDGNVAAEVAGGKPAAKAGAKKKKDKDGWLPLGS